MILNLYIIVMNSAGMPNPAERRKNMAKNNRTFLGILLTIMLATGCGEAPQKSSSWEPQFPSLDSVLYEDIIYEDIIEEEK